MVGKLIKLLDDKGFGFIAAEGKEYFLHRSEFSGHWNDLADDFHARRDIYLEFDEDLSNSKGPRAAKAVRTDHPNQAQR